MVTLARRVTLQSSDETIDVSPMTCVLVDGDGVTVTVEVEVGESIVFNFLQGDVVSVSSLHFSFSATHDDEEEEEEASFRLSCVNCVVLAETVPPFSPNSR
mmetsp:Transcript_41307/g.62631  ORF Transcript_41307/g.62631 Transcript_41307/m.62631 type:complete len:101 (-) Transcript_41307:1098-1400(-)